MLYPKALNQLIQTHSDVFAAVVCALFLLLGWLALHLQWLGIALLLLPVAYVIGGFASAREGLTTLWEEKEFDVDLLMIVAALGAAGLGLWRREYYLIVDGAVLILIFAISGALEGVAMRRTEKSIRSLMSLTPDTARVLRQGKEEEVLISSLQVGEEIVVKPGELIPCDGLILSGLSTINQAAITGESTPVEKTVGDEIYAGTLNGYGALRVKLHQPPESSLIQRVIRLVEQAQQEAPPSQEFMEKLERSYAKVIIITGILLAVVPPVLWRGDWEAAIYRALIFLVVASPCALMAAIMPTLLSGIANGARQGILFKNGSQLERMGKVRAIAFDKTGTLTTGKPEVYQVIPAPGYGEIEVLNLAVSVEIFSEHPIGEAIAREGERLLNVPTAKNIYALPGEGIMGNVDGQLVIVGKLGLIQNKISQIADELKLTSEKLEKSGKTVVWVACGQNIVGLIAIADKIRPEAAMAIAQLKNLGIEEIVMLTGDNRATAETVAQSLGMTQVYAELLPEDKLSIIRRLQGEYGTVAMVGDGINDAPALAQASVGVAMGINGSDVTLDTADIVLMADKLEKIAVAVKLGRRSQSIIKQNIIFALGSVGLLLIANFVANLTMPLGVIGHEGSTVLVTLSGLRLLRRG
ncbi:heavy metal translocating P-type ATPase [Calothrix sp. 336/3]|uniref:heavy metal translocating P-type ATPase n=1 Tax=Calothrix sp. 336/3 TaxID=1337936 RepID=UPI0004E3BE7C|nr:heavy metal translocating P-type ATPase [Calothrix sp. 336/3]AKG23729.1 ATPase [Calothrix sp. 336/3]